MTTIEQYCASTAEPFSSVWSSNVSMLLSCVLCAPARHFRSPRSANALRIFYNERN